MAHRNPVNLLRAIAVLLVFCHHYAHYMHTDLGIIGFYGGMIGVQLFFLISGYLIIKTAINRDVFLFLRGRILRIYPTYWTILIIASLIFQPVLPYAFHDASYFWINFLALSHLSPYAAGKFDVLTVSWTLTIEWLWYLTAPLLLFLYRKSPSKKHAWNNFWIITLLGAIALQVLWYFAVKSQNLDGFYVASIEKLGFSGIPENLRTAFMYSAAPSQFVFFIIGACIYIHEKELRQKNMAIYAVIGAITLTTPSFWLLGIGLDPSFVSGLGLAAFFVIALQSSEALSKGVLRPLHWIGDWSYPLYLIHVPIFLTGSRLWQTSGIQWFIPYLFVSLAIAGVVHLFIEKPSMRFSNFLDRRSGINARA